MRRFTEPIFGQLRHPRGRLAPVTAAVLNVVNRPINRWAVDALELSGDEDVLDVGFGGGVGLAMVLDRLSTGRAVGVDISEEMVGRGAVAFRHHIMSGTLGLARAAAEGIPFADASFDRAYTVNTIFFWSDVPAGIAELLRVLRPTGRLVIAAPTPGFVLARAAGLAPPCGIRGPGQVRTLVHQAGFAEVDLRRRAGGALIVAAR